MKTNPRNSENEANGGGSILSRIVRVAENLFRDPASDRYYGVKKIGGKRKLHSLDTCDRAKAKGELAKWIAKVEAGDATASDLKFDALVQNFLDGRAAKKKNTVTGEKGVASILRKTFELGMNVPVRKIKTSDLLKWLNAQQIDRNWKNRTFNAARLFLLQMFALAEADRVVTRDTNPFQPKLIKPKKRSKVIRKIPTWAQFEAIIESVREQKESSEQSANFLDFLGRAGVGQAEASDLKWRDINHEKIRFIRRKTGAEFFVPIYEWLAPLIARLRAQRTSKREDTPVFDVKDCKKALTAACKRLRKANDDFPHFSQRNLRAMLIKRLYDASVPVKRIAQWQGHSDGGKLIQEVYTEVFCDSDAAAEAADLARVTGASDKKIVQMAA